MAKSEFEKTEKIGASAQFEAEIRKRARPLLSEEEQQVEGRKQAALECRMAAARARESEKHHAAVAEDYEKQAEAFEKGR